MKHKQLLPLLLCSLSSVLFADQEATAKPIALFNGTDLTGWHVDVPKADKNPEIEASFVVRDGLLVSLGNPKGHLITDAIYQDYRLELEYRFAGKPGNCGVLVHASTPRALYKMFPASIEVQMMHQNAGDFWCIAENIEVENMEERRPKKSEDQEFGGTAKDARRILNLTDDSEKPVGEWNKMVIECQGDEVKVWVNDDLVNHGAKSTATKGQIALQAEGSEVEFKGLTLSPLKES
ncbi:MAG: 3-keto-disaccharide hydrolase [Roseibacillus sp.]